MDTHRVLLRHLEEDGRVLDVSNNFSKQKTNSERVDFAYNLLEKYEFLPAITTDNKNNALSVDFRQKGNEMFKQRKFKQAIDFYTRSIANADNSSVNLALAYSNRSAALFEIGLFKESLRDIEISMINKNCPDNIKPKLEARKEKATSFLNKQDESNFVISVPEISVEDKNPLVNCASQAVQIQCTKEEGRHIVATRDIQPGEILAVESPFCHILIDDFYTTCHHCLKVCYNLLPCDRCTCTMYCSGECQKNGYSYHKFECPIVATLRITEMDKLKILPLRIALVARNKYNQIDELRLKEGEIYHSDRYDEIHNLVANTESRCVADLFERATSAAIIFHLVKNYTPFFKNDEDNQRYEQVFKELLLYHMQTGPCNFHEITRMKATNNTLEDKEIGAGAFAFLSMFNHSCNPNVTRICYGTSIAVVALETIGRGQHCFDNYGYHHALMKKQDRQKHLKKQYFFDCQCEACLQDFPLYRDMISTNQEEVVTLEDINKLQEGDVDKAKEIYKEMIKQIKEVSKEPKPNKTLNELQEVLKQCYFIFSSVRTPV